MHLTHPDFLGTEFGRAMNSHAVEDAHPHGDFGVLPFACWAAS